MRTQQAIVARPISRPSSSLRLRTAKREALRRIRFKGVVDLPSHPYPSPSLSHSRVSTLARHRHDHTHPSIDRPRLLASAACATGRCYRLRQVLQGVI